LQELLASNYAELVQALASEIATEGKPTEARQMASIFLKNTLNAKSHAPQRDAHERWKRLDPAVRNSVKETLLKALLSAEVGIPKAAAIVAAEVACVELPFLEWPTFVTTVTSIVSDANSSESAKLAALQCLGDTCERVDQVQVLLGNVPDLNETTVNAMLTTIVSGVQPSNSEALRLAALEALFKSLQFCHGNMEVPAERDFIVKNAILGAATSPDPRARQLAFSCLDAVAELYYEKLPDYMTQIFELTVTAIRTDVEEVKMAAIEFWSSVAANEEAMLLDDEDKDNGGPVCQKYVEAAMPMLVPILLETLSTQADEIDDDEFDLRAAGASCLEAFSITVTDPMVPIVIPFVQQNITNTDWRLRDAAIVAFSCLLDGPSTTALGPFVSQSIPVLLAAFGDANEIVRDDATHCVSNISKLHLTAVQGDQVHGIIQGLLGKLQESPKLANRACTAMFNICKSLKSPDGNMPASNLLSAPMLPLMQALLGAMDRPDAGQNNLRVAAMSAASELVTASALDVQPILKDLLPVIIERIESALKMDAVSSEDRESQGQVLGLLVGLITSLFQRLQRSDVVAVVDRVMSVIVLVLQVPNSTCHEEAFFSIGAIATSLEEEFTVRAS
jgi:importin subunit beta-1